MKAIICFILLTTNYIVAQSSEIKILQVKQSNYESIIRAYEDSLADIAYAITELNKSSFQKSMDLGELIVYSTTDAPLRSGPSNFDSKIKALPKDSKLRVTGNTGIYLHVESAYGNGYVSKNLIKEQPSTEKVTKRKSNYTPPNKRSYSSSSSQYQKSRSIKKKSTKSYRPKSYRSYIRGPRGGCYYINSNGNKTYVSRSLCN